ncbi:MAG TPA: MauE/DoxX family redox-associated membrane protein [Solirubrobacterales bacterium]|nr:MauE/DoxX family redox-associated membrane protein [Solirubrobacterales bacterium]
MLEVAGRLILGGLLAGAALAKLASPASSRAALATFGVDDGRAQAFVWTALIATELALAAGVIAGLDGAAWLAAALMATFAATMVGALMRGRAGAPCACFGARSTVGWRGVARNLALAAAFAALPFLPSESLSTEDWLTLGLAGALIACAGLAVAVLALAREVGMLRLRLGPASALEIPEEGPELGSRAAVVPDFDFGPDAELALAVFVSEHCRVCAALEPAVASLARDPLLAVATFEESERRGVWDEFGVPGSPYAVALSRDGTVLAKGTFNNLAQLESVVAAAERRRDENAFVESVGGG